MLVSRGSDGGRYLFGAGFELQHHGRGRPGWRKSDMASSRASSLARLSTSRAMIAALVTTPPASTPAERTQASLRCPTSHINVSCRGRNE